MSKLMWWIYLAEVIGNLGVLFVALAMGLFATAAGFAFIGALIRDGFHEGEPSYVFGVWMHSKIISLLISGCVVAFVAALIPSTKTIYLMVGARLAEVTVTSEDMQIVVQALRERVTDALKEGGD